MTPHFDSRKFYKIIVCGSRGFNDYQFLTNKLNEFIRDNPTDKQIQIVSGGARGADKLGEKWYNAHKFSRNLSLCVFRPDWEQYGKRAGIMRNTDMAEYADACIAFWDGKSTGTKNMIKQAEERSLKVKILLCNKVNA